MYRFKYVLRRFLIPIGYQYDGWVGYLSLGLLGISLPAAKKGDQLDFTANIKVLRHGMSCNSVRRFQTVAGLKDLFDRQWASSRVKGPVCQTLAGLKDLFDRQWQG